jgi:hypothetical protein
MSSRVGVSGLSEASGGRYLENKGVTLVNKWAVDWIEDFDLCQFF